MSEHDPGATPDPVQPGWYPDPWLSGQQRYWNGTTWTAHAFPDGVRDTPTANTTGTPAGIPSAAPPPPEWAVPVATPLPLPAPAPPPSPPRRPWWPPRGGALVAVLLIGAFAIGLIASQLFPATSHKSPSVALPPVTLPQSPTTTLPPVASSPDPGASALAGLVVRQSDVPSDVTVAPIDGGTTVAGGATLDLCNGTFPSESQRTARLQVAADDALGDEALSTEAVLYRTAAGTAQAFTELRSVAANCPAAPVVSPIGEPTTTTRFNAAPDSGWPQVPTVERLAFDFVTVDQSGQANHSEAVYLRRGRVLEGIYFPTAGGTQSAVDNQTTVPAIVNVFATRIAQLSASVVNGG